jgi:hypothetical protein
VLANGEDERQRKAPDGPPHAYIKLSGASLWRRTLERLLARLAVRLS